MAKQRSKMKNRRKDRKVFTRTAMKVKRANGRTSYNMRGGVRL
jgi:hypothetical protein